MKWLKKTAALVFIFSAAIVVSSCEEDLKNNIKVNNDCTWEIMVSVTNSKTEPSSSSFKRIAPGSGKTFSGLEHDTYYVYVFSANADAVIVFDMEVDMLDPWNVIWQDGEYVIEYHKVVSY